MKIPFIENSKYVRDYLEAKGFLPLRFFQGKAFIYPLISERANSKSEWKEYDYSTFSESEIKDTFLDCRKNIKLFKNEINKIKPI